jgi:hypothetical protein
MAALGMFWTMRGEHIRILALVDAAADALRDWQPPPELRDAARTAIAVMMSNTMVAGSHRADHLQEMLRGLGTGVQGRLRLSGLATAMLAYDPADPGAFRERLEQLTQASDEDTAASAYYWLSNMRENAGDPLGATVAAERALALGRDDDGPWSTAMPHAMLAQLRSQRGDHASAAEHARAALPVMQRLGAADDEMQLRCVLVFAAIADGRLTEAEAELRRGMRSARAGWRSVRRPSSRCVGRNCCSHAAIMPRAWPRTVTAMPACMSSSFLV